VVRLGESTMELHDSLFNMRARFYEESRRRALNSASLWTPKASNCSRGTELTGRPSIPATRRRELLKKLLVDLALKEGSFKLSSGAHSRWYVDARMVTTHPLGARLVAEEMAVHIGEVDAVGGPELGAVPILGALAALKGYPTFIVRKRAKGHGLGKMVEGHLGQRVALIDDVATTGQSLQRAIEVLEDAHAQVVKVLVLVSRGWEGEAIFTLEELIAHR